MKTLPIGEARAKLNSIVREGEATGIKVGRFARAVVLPLPKEAASVEYEVIADPTGDEWREAGAGCIWLMRPVRSRDG